MSGSKSTSTLQTLRILDAACEKWSIENGRSPGTAPTPEQTRSFEAVHGLFPVNDEFVRRDGKPSVQLSIGAPGVEQKAWEPTPFPETKLFDDALPAVTTEAERSVPEGRSTPP